MTPNAKPDSEELTTKANKQSSNQNSLERDIHNQKISKHHNQWLINIPVINSKQDSESKISSHLNYTFGARLTGSVTVDI